MPPVPPEEIDSVDLLRRLGGRALRGRRTTEGGGFAAALGGYK